MCDHVRRHMYDVHVEELPQELAINRCQENDFADHRVEKLRS